MKFQPALDKSAISLSVLCMAHCLIIPVIPILLPTLFSLSLGGELFHKLLLVAVVPLSAVALLLGCQKHQHWTVLIWGIAGLSLLVFAGIFAHDLMGEAGEKTLTVVGSMLLVYSHYKNYRRCGEYEQCEC